MIIYILIHNEAQPHPYGFTSHADAWRAACELARLRNTSPYEWTIHEIEVSL